MNNKIPLSVIIILNKNLENKYLPKVLSSVNQFSEVILFDTGNDFIGDFAKVRNEALKKAKYEYVLFLDSDEVLEKSSLGEIKDIVENNLFDLISITRTDVFLGEELKFGEAGATSLLRLGKKNKMKYQRVVHEVVEIKKEYKLMRSTIKIKHYSHQSISKFFEKIVNYANLEAKYRGKQNHFDLIFELLFFPPLKFLYNFFIKQGYRDGMRGFVYALMMSLHSFFVRVNLIEKSLR